jgi:hypothetical protein
MLIASGKYKFRCLDEGAEIVANGAISAVQVNYYSILATQYMLYRY